MMTNTFCRLSLLCLFSLYFGLTLRAQEYPNIVYDSTFLLGPEYGWEEGDVIPNIKFVDVDGKWRNLYDLLNKVTIIDFWFIACKPCIANKSYLQRYYKQFGVNIVSISVDERASTVKRYAEANGMPWINVHDNGGYKTRFKRKISLSKEFPDNSYPDYILITPDKRIAKYYSTGESIKALGVALQEYFSKNTEAKK